MDRPTASKPEANSHVHPALAEILNAFSGPPTTAYRGPHPTQETRLRAAIINSPGFPDAQAAPVRPDRYLPPAVRAGVRAVCLTPAGGVARVTSDPSVVTREAAALGGTILSHPGDVRGIAQEEAAIEARMAHDDRVATKLIAQEDARIAAQLRDTARKSALPGETAAAAKARLEEDAHAFNRVERARRNGTQPHLSDLPGALQHSLRTFIGPVVVSTTREHALCEAVLLLESHGLLEASALVRSMIDPPPPIRSSERSIMVERLEAQRCEPETFARQIRAVAPRCPNCGEPMDWQAACPRDEATNTGATPAEWSCGMCDIHELAHPEMAEPDPIEARREDQKPACRTC